MSHALGDAGSPYIVGLVSNCSLASHFILIGEITFYRFLFCVDCALPIVLSWAGPLSYAMGPRSTYNTCCGMNCWFISHLYCMSKPPKSFLPMLSMLRCPVLTLTSSSFLHYTCCRNRRHKLTPFFCYVCHANLGPDSSGTRFRRRLEHCSILSQKVACTWLNYHLWFIPFQLTFDYNTCYNNSGHLGEFIIYVAFSHIYFQCQKL